MAGPAQAFKVGRVISTTVCFRNDVVDGSRSLWSLVPQAALAQVLIAYQNLRPEHVPFAAIATLVSALPALMQLPAFITVLLAVSRAACCCLTAAELTAGTRDSYWHIHSHKKTARRRLIATGYSIFKNVFP